MESKYQIKSKAVAEYLTSLVSYRQLQHKYRVSHATLCRWVSASQKATRALKEKDKHHSLPSVSEEVPTDIKQLQEELRKVRLHNQLLNAIIDIAEEQLNIDIRKKSGAKRSKK